MDGILFFINITFTLVYPCSRSGLRISSALTALIPWIFELEIRWWVSCRGGDSEIDDCWLYFVINVLFRLKNIFDRNLFNHIDNEEKFDDTKGVIKNRKSKKDRQYNAYYKIRNVLCCVIYWMLKTTSSCFYLSTVCCWLTSLVARHIGNTTDLTLKTSQSSDIV
jgi:hypothetical protein